MSLPGSQSDDNGGGIGQGHLSDDGRPTGVRGPLQTKEEENAAKEAFNGAAFAQFFLGPALAASKSGSFVAWGSMGRQRSLPG